MTDKLNARLEDLQNRLVLNEYNDVYADYIRVKEQIEEQIREVKRELQQRKQV